MLSTERAARAEMVPRSDAVRPARSGPDVSRDDVNAGAAPPKQDRERLRFGVIGGVGFPRPFAIEGMIKIERTIALGVEYGALPTLTVSGVDTSFWALAADARIFPFRGPFFLGVRAGRQRLGAEGSVAVERYGTLNASMTVDTTFVNPRIGFLWTWAPGFTIGIDAGVQIPVGSSVSTTVPPRYAQYATQSSVYSDVVGMGNTLGKNVLPTVDLLRLGFLL